MDIIEVSAKILSIASNGASRSRIVSSQQQLTIDEINWVVDSLVHKQLLELDSLHTYWTTTDGLKIIEMHRNMERMLYAQQSLI